MSANEDPIGLDGLDDEEDLANVDVNSEQGDEADIYQDEPTEEAARKWWMDQSWEQKWRGVVKLLASNTARWEAPSGDDPRGDVLEEYKRQALVERNPHQGTRPTVLHELARDFGVGDFQDIPEDTRLKVVKYLLRHVQQRAPAGGYDMQEDPILEVAMRCDNLKFIQYLVDNCAETLPDLLDAYSLAGMNSLHYAFKIHIPEALKHGERVRKRLTKKKNLNLKTFLVLLRQFVQRARPETVAAQDKKESNTPIHYALSYELCRLESEFYRDKIVRPLVTKGDLILKKQHGLQFNKKDESPYLYYKHSEEIWKQEHSLATAPKVQVKVETKAQQQQDDAKKLRDPKEDIITGQGSKFIDEKRAAKELSGKAEVGHKELNLTQDQTLLRKEKQLSAQRGTADMAFQVEPQVYGPPRRVMTDKFPSSPNLAKAPEVTLPSRFNITTSGPPQNGTQPNGPAPKLKASQAVGEGPATPAAPPTAKLDAQTAAVNIRNYLKLHYIRTRADMEAKELIYGRVASGQSPLCPMILK